MDDRKSLEKRLGDFLGFDDDDESLGDVLDQLLDIDNEGDLLDYISQLLGSRSEEIIEFVKDVTRFQKGLPLEGVVAAVQEEEEAKTKSPPVADDKKVPPKASTAPTVNNSKKQQQTTTKAQTKATAKSTKQPPPPAANKKEAKKNVPPASAKKKATMDPTTEKVAGPKKDDEEVVTAPKEPDPPKKKYALPPRGKPKVICSCFGTLHKPLTNCLYCGRISCVEEGYDFCPFPSCGYLVEEVKPPEGEPFSSKAKAWQHKERLLRYDRESAKRTVVLDDQADYYSNQRSNWLTEEEQANAEVQDDEQRRNMHQRKKQVLNIAF